MRLHLPCAALTVTVNTRSCRSAKESTKRLSLLCWMKARMFVILRRHENILRLNGPAMPLRFSDPSRRPFRPARRPASDDGGRSAPSGTCAARKRVEPPGGRASRFIATGLRHAESRADVRQPACPSLNRRRIGCDPPVTSMAEPVRRPPGGPGTWRRDRPSSFIARSRDVPTLRARILICRKAGEYYRFTGSGE